MAGVGFAVPIMLHLEITTIVSGAIVMLMELMRIKLMSKSQKHYEFKTLADSKLNSIKINFQSLKRWANIGTRIQYYFRRTGQVKRFERENTLKTAWFECDRKKRNC